MRQLCTLLPVARPARQPHCGALLLQPQRDCAAANSFTSELHHG
jgi:hypothetical protein